MRNSSRRGIKESRHSIDKKQNTTSEGLIASLRMTQNQMSTDQNSFILQNSGSPMNLKAHKKIKENKMI